MDEVRAEAVLYKESCAEETDQLAIVQSQANNKLAVYSQELTWVLANNQELIPMCQRSEDARAYDRNSNVTC